VHPARRQDTGPRPKPRWLPLPQCLSAPVGTSARRRRSVAVKHRVVFGTMERVTQGLAACGWQRNPALVDRWNRAIRQRVAAVGRRVNTWCQGQAGVHPQRM
jgi:hypothetical protein